MSVPSADIRMGGVATELQYGSITDITMTGILYATSTLSYQIESGSYHNLAMGLPGINNKFANVIATVFNGGTDMKLGNWAEYNHDASAKVNIIINNGSSDDVDVRVYINGAPGVGGTPISAGIVPAFNVANINLPDYDTGVAAFSNFYGSGGYWISADMTDMNPGGRPCRMIVNSVDVDATLGTGTSRFTYTTNGTPGGAWDLNPNTGGSPFSDVIISGDNGAPYPSDGVSWNRRTAIIIDIL